MNIPQKTPKKTPIANKNARHKQGVYFCNTVGKTVLQLHAMKGGSCLHAHVFIMGFDNILSTHQKKNCTTMENNGPKPIPAAKNLYNIMPREVLSKTIMNLG